MIQAAQLFNLVNAAVLAVLGMTAVYAMVVG